MLRKIYRELVAIRKELHAIRKNLELQKKLILFRELYSNDYKSVRTEHGSKEPIQWRRFELLTENEEESSRLEKVINEHGLSRQDLAVILFGLRVRPEFGKKDFGI